MNDLVMSERSHIEQVVSYKYLGHEILIGRDNQTSSFWKAKQHKVGHSNLSKEKANQCVLSVLTYGAETLTLTKKTKRESNAGHIIEGQSL